MDPAAKEAVRKLAVGANGKTWKLLQKADRSESESLEMIAAAYASLHLWDLIGTDVNRANGHWLISRVFATTADARLCLLHAEACSRFTAQAEGIKDFGPAYASECMARAYALAGRTDLARPAFERAKKLGAVIANAEDKRIFEEDLKTEPWFGLER